MDSATLINVGIALLVMVANVLTIFIAFSKIHVTNREDITELQTKVERNEKDIVELKRSNKQ